MSTEPTQGSTTEAGLTPDPLDGLSIRAAAVRELHAAEYIGGGLIVCMYCTLLRTKSFVIYPCRTLQLLDGLAAP